VLGLLRAYQKNDPAAQSLLEVLLLYPGVKALGLHRLAHAFWRLRVPLLARALSEFARFRSSRAFSLGLRFIRARALVGTWSSIMAWGL